MRKSLIVSVLLVLTSVASAAPTVRAGAVWFPPTSAAQIATGERGIWVKSADGLPYFRKSDGTDVGMTGGGGGGYATVQDEGGALTTRTIINFTGAGVTCVDNAGATRTDCTIPSAGSVVGLSAAYNGGSVAADQTELIQSGKGGAVIFKANAGATGALFKVQDSSANNLLSISDNANLTLYAPSGSSLFLGANGTGIVTVTQTQVSVSGANTAASGAFSIAPTAATSGTQTSFVISGPSSTNQTLSTEINGVLFDMSATRQWATGAITTQREFYIRKPTYAFVGASTITDSVLLELEGAPVAGTNATQTRAWALRWQGGLVGSNTTVNFTDTVASGNTAFVFNHVNGSNDPIAMFQQGGTNQAFVRSNGTNVRIGADSSKNALELSSPSGNTGITMTNTLFTVCEGGTCLDVAPSAFNPESTNTVTIGSLTKEFKGLFNSANLSCGENTQSGTTFTATVTDCVINMTNSAARTVTLPAASTVPVGHTYFVWDGNGNAGTNNVSVAPNGTDNIDGANATKAVVTANFAHSTCQTVSSTAWLCGVNN